MDSDLKNLMNKVVKNNLTAEETEKLITLLEKEGITFVRGVGQISIFGEQNKNATGWKMTAREVVEAYGPKTVEEIFWYGSAVLLVAENEPAESFKNRRLHLGLSLGEVAAMTGVLKVEDIEDAENYKTRTSIHKLKSIASILGLDPRFIAFKKADPNKGFLY